MKRMQLFLRNIPANFRLCTIIIDPRYPKAPPVKDWNPTYYNGNIGFEIN